MCLSIQISVGNMGEEEDLTLFGAGHACVGGITSRGGGGLGGRRNCGRHVVSTVKAGR